MSQTPKLENRHCINVMYVGMVFALLSNTSTAVKITSNVSLTITRGAYLDGTIYSRIDIVGIKMCATLCARKTNCSSFNFNKEQIQCQLLLANDSFTPTSVSNQDFSYSTRDSWMGFGGPCERDPCSEPHQMCVDRQEKRFCVRLECMSYPDTIVRHTTIQSATSNTARSVGNVFTYVCNDGFQKFGPGEISCQPDLNFTSPDPALTCYRFYGEWVLVTRFTAGIGVDTRVAWHNVSMNSDKDNDVAEECFSVMTSAACKHHYKSGLVGQWSALDIAEVKVAVYEEGVEKAYVVFDGAGSTQDTWFAPSKIIDSSWNDVTTGGSYNVFSIDGLSGQVERSFYISQYLMSCHDDLGWLFIIEGMGFCPYDTITGAKYPYFMYSNKTGVSLQESETNMADVFAILLKINNFP